ncbi:hypothetical protein EVAR_13248_1 [Eumeta japonica]|uniref:Uncharacterized protein n=1 Tax=Eumeta variegata TaxID=151549 RepID=A0A4C1TSE6_EUMVA|nr:hypothetical protein EVAR_13248_1 [Eumeta japonica]
MTYASPVFAHVAPKALDRLQIIPNKFLRDAAYAHWCIWNSILHRDLELPTITKFMKDVLSGYSTSRNCIPMRSFVRQLLMSYPNPIILSVGHGMYLPINMTLLQRQ